jgi:hypothetical protein
MPVGDGANLTRTGECGSGEVVISMRLPGHCDSGITINIGNNCLTV